LPENQAVSTPEDTAVSITLAATDPDTPVEDLLFTVVAAPQSGVLSGSGPDQTYTPNADFHGADQLAFTVSDGTTVSAPATVTVTVTPVNDAPVAQDLVLDTPEDTELAVHLSASDADGDPLSYTVLTGPAHGSLGGVPPDLVYHPQAGYVGPDAFTYAVDDGTVQGSPATVQLTVTQATETVVFSDSFEVSEWNGLWAEDSQRDWHRSTQRATHGTRSAEVDGPASAAALTSVPIDLQGRTNARVTFDWLIESGLDSGESLEFRVSTNGGSAWTQRAILRGNIDRENFWHRVTLELTGIGQLRLQFRGQMSGSNEDADVDNVSVVAY
jgi:hypothetical protein